MRHRPGTDRFEHGRRRTGCFGCYLLGGRDRTDRAVRHFASGTWFFGGGPSIAVHHAGAVDRAQLQASMVDCGQPFRKSICQAEVRAVGDVRKAGPAPTVAHRAQGLPRTARWAFVRRLGHVSRSLVDHSRRAVNVYKVFNKSTIL
jgi:hypothetical protein